MKRATVCLGLFLVAALPAGLLAAQLPTTTGVGTPHAVAAPPSTPSAVTLYDQTGGAGTVSIDSQDFETAYDNLDDETADDFVVPAGTFWQVTGAHFPGVYYNGTGPAPTVHLHVYADAAGLPGAPVCNYLDVVPTDTAGTFDVSLPTPCVLSAGSYWVSVIAHMDLATGGQWGWTERAPFPAIRPCSGIPAVDSALRAPRSESASRPAAWPARPARTISRSPSPERPAA